MHVWFAGEINYLASGDPYMRQRTGPISIQVKACRTFGLHKYWLVVELKNSHI